MRRGLCDGRQAAKCLHEMGEEMLSWACSQCEKKKEDDLDEYTLKIFRIRHLKMAGYPFRANDLSLEEWEDLGRAEEYLTWLNKSKSSLP